MRMLIIAEFALRDINPDDFDPQASQYILKAKADIQFVSMLESRRARG